MNKLIFTLATFILLFSTYFHSLDAINQDLGRHVKTGQLIVETLSVPKTNLYSYTFSEFPFVNHHWGSEVIFYFSGFTGAFILTLISSVIAFSLVYFFAYKKNDPLSLGVVSFLSLGILFERTDVRPEAFSFLLLALFMTILFKNRETPTKWIYALIPLQLLWVNIHIYWLIGLIVIGLFFLDALITYFVIARNVVTKQSHTFGTFGTFDTSGTSQLLFVLIACCLATLVNPNGLSGALYPLKVFENYGYQIEENQNIFFLWELFQKRTIIFFWIFVISLLGTLSIRAKYTRPIDWLLALTFTILGIQAIRNFPLLVFATFIPFTYHLSPLLTPLHKKTKLFFLLISFLLLLFLWQLYYINSMKPIGFTTPTSLEKAVTFLETNTIHGPIFNNFDIGSYLIFRLYPKEKIFVDGRPEAYPASFFQTAYIPMQQDQTLFEKQDQKYRFNTIFFSHTDQTPWAKQFLKDIVKNKKWHVVYLDDTVIILTKDTSVKKLSLKNYPIDTSLSLQSFYRLFSVFQTIEETDKQMEILQHVIQKYPTDCNTLALLLQSTPPTDSMSAIYQSRFVAHCQ